MSARKVAGRAAQTRASAAGGVANDLTALRFTWRSMTTPAPIGQASACKPNQAAAARWQGFKATVPQGLEPRPAGAESVYPEVAPSDRISAPRAPRNLFNPVEGLSMEKPARASFRAPSKFVPLVRISRISETTSGASRKPLIQRMYTLCEVQDGKRQSVPLPKPALSVPQNRPGSGLSFGLLDGRPKPCSRSRRRIGRTASNTSPFTDNLSVCRGNTGKQTPRQHWAGTTKHPANPLKPFLAQRTGGAA